MLSALQLLGHRCLPKVLSGQGPAVFLISSRLLAKKTKTKTHCSTAGKVNVEITLPRQPIRNGLLV